jgi:putative endonuclease
LTSKRTDDGSACGVGVSRRTVLQPSPFGHAKRKGCTRLVWFERHQWVVEAIALEKRIKGWQRDWKLKLIEDANPAWLDLAADWYPVNDPDWTPPPEAD